MDVKAHVRELGAKAREASRALARASTDEKNRALRGMAAAIISIAQQASATTILNQEQQALVPRWT